ncbi:uncharacterized protein LOC107363494 [Tetranychus urticae]|nr:uncharacterized protein LOC107363494 [Tetranychus urticae]
MKLHQFFLVNVILTITVSIIPIDCQILSFLALASLARQFLRPRQSYQSSNYFQSQSPLQSSPYEQMLSSGSHMNPVMVAPPSPFSPLSSTPNSGFGFPMSNPSQLMSKNMFSSPVTDWSRLLSSESQGVPSVYGQYPFGGFSSGLSGYSGLSGLSGLPSFSSSLYEPKLPFGLSSMYPFEDMTGQRKRNFRLTPF